MANISSLLLSFQEPQGMQDTTHLWCLHAWCFTIRIRTSAEQHIGGIWDKPLEFEVLSVAAWNLHITYL
jgi:hypothetical protein